MAATAAEPALAPAPAAPALPPRAALWLFGAGVLLLLVDLPLIMADPRAVTDPDAPARFLLVDVLPDPLGALLALTAMLWPWTRLPSVAVRRALALAGVLFLLDLPRTVIGLAVLQLSPLTRDLYLAGELLELEGVLLAALAWRWACDDAGWSGAAASWRLTTQLFLVNYLVPLLALLGLTLLIFERGQAADLPPLMVIMAPVMAVAVVHLLLSVRRTLAPAVAAVPLASGAMRQVWRVSLGLTVCGLVLVGGLLLAYHYYPRRPPPPALGGSGSPAPTTPEPPAWQRWLSPGRAAGGAAGEANRRRGVRVQRVEPARPNARGTGDGSGGLGGGGLRMDPSHLSLRETADAQAIVGSQFGVSDDESWSMFRQATADGPFRPFEEDRFLTRLRLRAFLDDQDDRAKLERLYQAAQKTVASPYASFEDLFYAGFTSLLMKHPEQAEGFLRRARQSWPSAGRGYGNVYLYHLFALAVLERGPAVLEMLEAFQENYPDWLYVETYLTDLDDLDKMYPKAPLLAVLRGRVQMLVHNDKAAVAAWQGATARGPLDRAVARQVRTWLQAAQRGAPP